MHTENKVSFVMKIWNISMKKSRVNMDFNYTPAASCLSVGLYVCMYVYCIPANTSKAALE